MAVSQGTFVWYELMTSDVDAAQAFYAKVVGWTIDAFPGPMRYLIAKAGDQGVAGLMNRPPEAAQAPVGWVGYIAVDDVDAMAGRVGESGGTVHRPPDDIPGVGRFAVVADPQGAIFMLFKGGQQDGPPPLATGTPGSIGWRELYTSDHEAGFAFYERLFGWKKTDAHDMGPMGVYQIFEAGGGEGGGMMNGTEGPPHWNYYFSVDDIDAAARRAGDGGGAIVHGPVEVPGGVWVLMATDPQGGYFALVGPKRG